MEKKAITFNESQRKKQEQRQQTGHQINKYNSKSGIEQKNILSRFFSNGWNIIRFIFFLTVVIIISLTLLSTFSSIPEGESFTLTLFFRQLKDTLK